MKYFIFLLANQVFLHPCWVVSSPLEFVKPRVGSKKKNYHEQAYPYPQKIIFQRANKISITHQVREYIIGGRTTHQEYAYPPLLRPIDSSTKTNPCKTQWNQYPPIPLHLQHTSQGEHPCTLSSPIRQNHKYQLHQSPSGPVYTIRQFALKMKIRFKPPGKQKPRVPSSIPCFTF